MGEEEDNDESIELTRRELAEDGEEGREGEVEGGEGGDRPSGEGEGGAHLRLGIPHVGHSQCEYPPRICIVSTVILVMLSRYLRVVTGPGPGQPKRARMFARRNIG